MSQPLTWATCPICQNVNGAGVLDCDGHDSGSESDNLAAALRYAEVFSAMLRAGLSLREAEHYARVAHGNLDTAR
jgi:hypothetical protein